MSIPIGASGYVDKRGGNRWLIAAAAGQSNTTGRTAAITNVGSVINDADSVFTISAGGLRCETAGLYTITYSVNTEVVAAVSDIGSWLQVIKYNRAGTDISAAYGHQQIASVPATGKTIGSGSATIWLNKADDISVQISLAAAAAQYNIQAGVSSFLQIERIA